MTSTDGTQYHSNGSSCGYRRFSITSRSSQDATKGRAGFTAFHQETTRARTDADFGSRSVEFACRLSASVWETSIVLREAGAACDAPANHSTRFPARERSKPRAVGDAHAGRGATVRAIQGGRVRYFLAFSYNMHDSSVSIADEKRVLLVLEAERFFGEKKKRCSKAEMETLIDVALRHCGIGIRDVEGVACTSYLNEHLPEKLRDVEWLAEGECT